LRIFDRGKDLKEAGSAPFTEADLKLMFYTQGSQSTLIEPHVLLPQSWMNFSMEKTPVRSSTDLPHSLWRPLELTLVIVAE
jgi:hypothetical protein